jgi:hypothetical protein
VNFAQLLVRPELVPAPGCVASAEVFGLFPKLGCLVREPGGLQILGGLMQMADPPLKVPSGGMLPLGVRTVLRVLPFPASPFTAFGSFAFRVFTMFPFGMFTFGVAGVFRPMPFQLLSRSLGGLASRFGPSPLLLRAGLLLRGPFPLLFRAGSLLRRLFSFVGLAFSGPPSFSTLPFCSLALLLMGFDPLLLFPLRFLSVVGCAQDSGQHNESSQRQQTWA